MPTLRKISSKAKTYQLWAETYPRDWGPWLNIARAYTQLGQEAPAIAAAQQGLRLDPSRGINYTVLAQAYLHDNRFADAKSAALQDLKIGKDSYNLHALLFELAFIDHDQAAMAHEIAWSQGRPSAWYSLQFQALAAASQGRYRLAEELFHTAYNVAQREHLAEAADEILVKQASMELDSGWPQTARTTLKRISSQNNDNPEFAWNQARFGDIAFAERFLASSNSNHSGTLMTYVEQPRLRAEIALHRGKSQEAIADLETTPTNSQAASSSSPSVAKLTRKQIIRNKPSLNTKSSSPTRALTPCLPCSRSLISGWRVQKRNPAICRRANLSTKNSSCFGKMQTRICLPCR
jgi:tetratricopeptide (TPR) repeat protein